MYASSTEIRPWRIDFKISELVVGELTRWRNDRLPSQLPLEPRVVGYLEIGLPTAVFYPNCDAPLPPPKNTKLCCINVQISTTNKEKFPRLRKSYEIESIVFATVIKSTEIQDMRAFIKGKLALFWNDYKYLSGQNRRVIYLLTNRNRLHSSYLLYTRACCHCVIFHGKDRLFFFLCRNF